MSVILILYYKRLLEIVFQKLDFILFCIFLFCVVSKETLNAYIIFIIKRFYFNHSIFAKINIYLLAIVNFSFPISSEIRSFFRTLSRILVINITSKKVIQVSLIMNRLWSDSKSKSRRKFNKEQLGHMNK